MRLCSTLWRIFLKAVKINKVFQWQEAYLLAAYKKTNFARNSSNARDYDVSQEK
jgi:hypothetical protein